MIPVFIPVADYITTLTAAMTAVLITAARKTIPDPMPGTRVAEMEAVEAMVVAAMGGTDID